MDTLTTPDVSSFEQIVSGLEIICDCGHPDGTPMPDGTSPCQRPADYTLKLHDCDTGQRNHIRSAVWCQKHLDTVLLRWGNTIALAETRGKTLHCTRCLLQLRAVEDLVWDVTPLK